MPSLRAQGTAQVHGRFEKDSISIGEAIPYSLTARYPGSQQIVFPDSTFSFAPLEFSRKNFFTTRSTGKMSYDSVVYWLTTFEIDSVQYLKLPVYVVYEKDCVAVYPAVDSIFLRHHVAVVPDSVSTEQLPLKTNTAYQKVKWILNYPVFLAIALSILIISVLVWIIFGKRVHKYFVLRRLNRNYQNFSSRFNQSLDQLSSGFTSPKAEAVMLIWKSYMEDLERYPYTKSTSREIVQWIHDGAMDDALQSIDRGIYGGYDSSLDMFRDLQRYSHVRFQKKEEEIKHG